MENSNFIVRAIPLTYGIYARVGKFMVLYPILLPFLKEFRGGQTISFCIRVTHVDDARLHRASNDEILHLTG